MNVRWFITDEYTFLAGGQRAAAKRNILLVRQQVKVQTGKVGSVKVANQLTRQLSQGGNTRIEVYNFSTQVEFGARWGNFSLRPAATLQLYDLRSTTTRYASAQLAIDYQFSESPWRLGLTGAAPVGGRIVRSYEQSELFYQQGGFTVFPAFVVGTANYAF